MKAVIMAGGKGTRISALNAELPKPLIEVCGKPIIEYGLDCLHANGIDDVIIVTGHLGEKISDYFGDGSRLGMNISYFHETEPLGTAGALFYLKDKLSSDFLLLNGDIIYNVDFSRMTAFHKEKGAACTLLTHPNSHPYDSALIITDADARVTEWLHKEEPRGDCKNRVNAGIHLLSRAVLERLTEPKKNDLDREILKPLVATNSVFAYDSPEYVFDVGTPERHAQVTRDVLSGKVAARNLINKQPAVFADRDGTLNVEKSFLSNIDDMELISDAAEAVARVNKSDYLLIVITNQPVIARGDCSLEELEGIHNRLETLLGKEGAYIDGLYFCPHHPDKGFEGERAEYKIECACRKPKPGMILEAAARYNIDLSRSYMIGDRASDVLCGINAGCKAVFIGTKEKLLENEDARKYAEAVPCVASFNEFVETILKLG
ncbi:MAG: HAD-IIIA family hydrolase [Ruminococcaceae bacterium]|nr:HAD-IIIA family hydrolase [Oscillospiraceae bacterium]